MRGALGGGQLEGGGGGPAVGGAGLAVEAVLREHGCAGLGGLDERREIPWEVLGRVARGRVEPTMV